MAELKRCPWLFPVFVLCVVSLGCPALIRGQPAVEIVSEPGFVAADGSWVVPYVVLGANGGELTALRDGRPLRVKERLNYSLAKRQEAASALAILLDLPPLDEAIRSAWAKDLAIVLDHTASPGVRASLAACGPGDLILPPSGVPDLAITDILAAAPSSRLWDSVIAALKTLAAPDLPERRVLLLLTDGREEITSRHVMVSCVEAAQRARVAVYVLSLADGTGAAAVRLQELARRTGGRLLTYGQPGAQDLAEILVWIGAAQGLVLEAEGAGLPAEITLQLSGDGGVQAVAVVAPRQVPRGPGWPRWLLIGGTLLAAGGAGYVLWRQRAVTAGDLLIRTKNGVRRFPIPRHGVTIGRDADNTMVLKSRQVSRHHAVIRVKGGSVIITDLRSSGGTTVNGARVGTYRLEPGDRIMLGGAVELVFKGRPTAS